MAYVITAGPRIEQVEPRQNQNKDVTRERTDKIFLATTKTGDYEDWRLRRLETKTADYED